MIQSVTDRITKDEIVGGCDEAITMVWTIIEREQATVQ